MAIKNKTTIMAKQIVTLKKKKFIRVTADMRPNAQIIPLKIVADDGRDFAIQNVLALLEQLLKILVNSAWRITLLL